MSECRRENAFLRHIIAFDGSDAGRDLERRLVRAETNERSVQRAALLVAGVAMLCAVGFGYGTVLQENFFFSEHQFVIDLLCAVGLASLVSLLVFGVLLLWFHNQLRRVQEECRRLLTTLLETRLGPSSAPQSAVNALQSGRGIREAVEIARRSEPSGI